MASRTWPFLGQKYPISWRSFRAFLMWFVHFTDAHDNDRIYSIKNQTGHMYKPTSIMCAIILSPIPPCLPLTPTNPLSLSITSRAESPVCLLWEWERKQTWHVFVCRSIRGSSESRPRVLPQGKGVMKTHASKNHTVRSFFLLNSSTWGNFSFTVWLCGLYRFVLMWHVQMIKENLWHSLHKNASLRLNYHYGTLWQWDAHLLLRVNLQIQYPTLHLTCQHYKV